MKFEAPRLTLVLQTHEELERLIAGLPDSDRAQISPLWLEQMRAARAGDPWAFAFSLVRHYATEAPASQAVLARCGFQFVGERIDPEDGRVWRFERAV